MFAIIQFIFFLVGSLLQLLIWAIIISAILSWLVAFNVINIRHPFARNLVHFLDAVTRPVLRPFQRIIPPMGGMDLSPIVVILVLSGAQRYLLPAAESFLLQLVAG